jgi:hypothetical protein
MILVFSVMIAVELPGLEARYARSKCRG